MKNRNATANKQQQSICFSHSEALITDGEIYGIKQFNGEKKGWKEN